MKSKWRDYIALHEKEVEDFNFGTILRLDCEGGYTEENSCFGM